MSFKRISVLAWKDIIDSIRTPRLLVIIITPLIIALCINLFFGDKLTLRIGVFSQDDTQLIKNLEQVELVEVRIYNSTETLRESVRNGEITVGVDLPANFDTLLINNELPSVNFIVGDNSQESQVGVTLVQQVIQSLSSNPLPIISSTIILKPDTLPGISIREDLSIDQYAIVLWLVMGIVGNGVMLVPTLIVEERERKTLDALLLSPLTYTEFAIGKAVVGVVYSIASSVLILLVQGGLSGDIFFIAVLIILGSLSLSFFGVLIGTLVENLHVLNSYGSVFVFLLTLPALIGMLGPNPFIQYLQILPTYPLVDGIVKTVSGQNQIAIPSLVLLCIHSALILAAVTLSLKRRQINR